MTHAARSGAVQSLERAFDLLELLASSGGELGLSELSTGSGLPLPTIHRLMRTLVTRGYCRQLPSRRYALGPGLMHLGDVAAKMLGTWARPELQRLVDVSGETANLAILDGDEVVYVGQVPSRHTMRMFTEVGRRFLPHSTGVGKALLAQLGDDEVSALVRRTGLPATTERTIVDVAALHNELARVRSRGYAVDDGEQEVGVRCVAVPLIGAPTPTAMSISGPASRLTRAAVDHVVPLLKERAAVLVQSLMEEKGVG
jgi:IclR family acetate operon transcriptional repressor